MDNNLLENLKQYTCFDESFDGKDIHKLELKSLTKEEALKAYRESGGETLVSKDLESRMAYIIPQSKTIEVVIISFDEDFFSDTLIDFMSEQGFRPMVYEELIQFATAYPEYQKQKTLVALGSTYVFCGGFWVAIANKNENSRYLFNTLCDLDMEWSPGFAFPFIPK